MWKQTSIAFCGFAVLLFVDGVASVIYYPDEKDAPYWIMLCSTLGLLIALALLIARWLWNRSGSTAATVYVLSLGMLVAIGALLTAMSPYTSEYKPPLVMRSLRLFSGIYLLYLCVAVIRLHARRPPSPLGAEKNREMGSPCGKHSV